MNSVPAKFAVGALALLLAPSLSFATTPAPKKESASVKSGSKSAKVSHRPSKKVRKARKARVRGQKNIDGERARQIQEALVREHYMSNSPSGKWDAATQEAMRRYQADQGWQSKSIPDSRALIRLGLGPDHGRLLNPESAMTTGPQLPRTSRAAPTSQGRSSSAVSSALPVQSVTPMAAPASSLQNASPAR